MVYQKARKKYQVSGIMCTFSCYCYKEDWVFPLFGENEKWSLNLLQALQLVVFWSSFQSEVLGQSPQNLSVFQSNKQLDYAKISYQKLKQNKSTYSHELNKKHKLLSKNLPPLRLTPQIKSQTYMRKIPNWIMEFLLQSRPR